MVYLGLGDVRTAHEMILQQLFIALANHLKELFLRQKLKYHRWVVLTRSLNVDGAADFVHAIVASRVVGLQFRSVVEFETMKNVINLELLSVIEIPLKHNLNLLKIKFPGTTKPEIKGVVEPGILCELVLVYPFAELSVDFFLFVIKFTKISDYK